MMIILVPAFIKCILFPAYTINGVVFVSAVKKHSLYVSICNRIFPHFKIKLTKYGHLSYTLFFISFREKKTRCCYLRCLWSFCPVE